MLSWSNDLAGIAAALTFLAVAIWKIWLRIKKENRDDGREIDQTHGYAAIVDNLRDEVERLSNAIDTIGRALENERMQRFRSQENEARLKIRIEILEAQVRSLGGEIAYD